MFSDEVIEKVYADLRTRRIPVFNISEMIRVFQDILSEIKEDKPDATISELFDE